MNLLSTRRRTILLSMLVLLIAAFTLTGCGLQKDSASDTPLQPSSGSVEQKNANTAEAQEITEGNALVIPLSEISETARFYPITVNGTEMEVLAVKAPDGTIRTAFNTCEVCYDSGRGYYMQDGNDLVCQNCQNRFSTSSVEISSSGCNPYPIFSDHKTITAESITLTYDYLANTTVVFSNWKTQY